MLVDSLGEEVMQCLILIVTTVRFDENIPEVYHKSVICPIYQKEDKLLCEIYRRISLLCTCFKVLSESTEEDSNTSKKILLVNTRRNSNMKSQMIDLIFSVQWSLEKCWEFTVDDNDSIERSSKEMKPITDDLCGSHKYLNTIEKRSPDKT